MGVFLSTPSARRATGTRWKCSTAVRISIHALREEGDEPPELSAEGSDKFLSTPSARRATRTTGKADEVTKDFYPRPPRGGRLPRYYEDWCNVLISIHALREEGDSAPMAASGCTWRFLSTPSARRATA